MTLVLVASWEAAAANAMAGRLVLDGEGRQACRGCVAAVVVWFAANVAGMGCLLPGSLLISTLTASLAQM